MADIKNKFTEHYPEPVDINLFEFLSDRESIEKLANQNGYYFVGDNGKLAIFSARKS